MAQILPPKDPAEVLDYRWNVTLDADDTLATATVTLTAGTAVLDAQAKDDGGVAFWISGGTDGETITLRGIATTAGGRTFEETLHLPIVDTSDGGVFTAAFPAFAAVSAASIAYWSTRAARTVDDSWPEADRDHARMLLAAHYLTQQGLGAGAEAESFASGTVGFRRVRSGGLELERFMREDTVDYDSTAYGRQFAKLLRAVKGGPRVTGTGALPLPCWPNTLPSW